MNREEIFRNIAQNLYRARESINWEKLNRACIVQLLPMRAEMMSAEMLLRGLAKNEGIEIRDMTGDPIPKPYHNNGEPIIITDEDWATPADLMEIGK